MSATLKSFVLLLAIGAAAGLWSADSPKPEQRSEVNVRDFGAVGDGVHDDTEAVRAAATWMAKNRLEKKKCIRRYKNMFSEAPTRPIFFPRGTYRITSPIVITDDTILLGEEGATILNAAPDKETFYIRKAHYLRVSHLTFDGGLTQLRLWTFNREASYLHVADCTFRNATGTSVVCVSRRVPKTGRPTEMAYGERRGTPTNNSTLMIVERSRFIANATALRLFSDGVTVRDCSFTAPVDARTTQLDMGSQGMQGVKIYLRDLDIAYPGKPTAEAAVVFEGGRGVFENVHITAGGDLTAIRSWTRMGEYKPSQLDIRGMTLGTGAAPVFSFKDGEIPSRVGVQGLVSTASVRKPLFAFDREPTEEMLYDIFADTNRLSRIPLEKGVSFVLGEIDARRFDATLPDTLRKFVHPPAPSAWRRRPLAPASGATFTQNMPRGPVFTGAPLPVLLEQARRAGGGVILLESDRWHLVEKPLAVPDRTRITCRGRAGIEAASGDYPLFVVDDGADCVFENLMLIDGRHAIQANGSSGRARLLDCSLFGQKEASIAASGVLPGALRIDVSGGPAGTPFLYRGNAAFTIDGYWYEELAEREADEYRPAYAAIVNEKGGRMFIRDFLGVPCYFQHSPKAEAYTFGCHPERRGEFRWVDNHGLYAAVNFRHGGEWGGLTPVFHFGDATTFIEGGNVDIRCFYLKSDRAVVVADRQGADVTVIDTSDGHYLEPFQACVRRPDGTYELLHSARLANNFPAGDNVPVWPKPSAGEPDDCVTFDCPFSWDGERPVSLELEAGGMCEVRLNDALVGTGPLPSAGPGGSRMAVFALSPRPGANRLAIRVKRGTVPGYLHARIREGAHLIARTAIEGDFVCGRPLEERMKPPHYMTDAIKVGPSR